MKYKTLTKEQILISLDRLTRFKPTREKYERVFSDIITLCLIEPKFRKCNFDELMLKDYAQTILNDSIFEYTKRRNKNYNINKILLDYENSIFKNDELTQVLLDNQINYESAFDLIDDNCVINLQWLKSIGNIEENLELNRELNTLKFPISKIMLVEGLTEEILLPSFSKFLGYDFYKKGIQVIPAGGKSQVVKLYYTLSEQARIPIFLLLDKDAEENIHQILPKLRSIDKIHLVSCGEFEDLLPLSLIIKTVNNELNNFATIAREDFDMTQSHAKNLEILFKQKGLHEFKKADFAKQVRENIMEESDISPEIKNIIKELQDLRST